MPYNEFTLELVETELGIPSRRGSLFPELPPVTVPSWLEDALRRGMDLALISEKARSEFIVAPVLLACRELTGNSVAILSGQRLDVDPARRLQGECDFILSLSETIPRLQAPLLMIVEAKRNDIETGIGQCAAQMIGAQIFNQQSGSDVETMFGCVTTGEDWQFLRFADQQITIDRRRFYINNVGEILAALLAIYQQFVPAQS